MSASASQPAGPRHAAAIRRAAVGRRPAATHQTAAARRTAVTRHAAATRDATVTLYAAAIHHAAAARQPAAANQPPATRPAAALTGRGSGASLPHPRLRAALRRRTDGGRTTGHVPPVGRRSGRRGGLTTSPRTGRVRFTGIAQAAGLAALTRPAWFGEHASRLAGPVRAGAGGDAGRFPVTAPTGAVGPRAGTRPHPAARASALSRAAAASPPCGDLPSHRRRHGDDGGRGLRDARPRAGSPARTSRPREHRPRPGGPARHVAV